MIDAAKGTDKAKVMTISHEGVQTIAKFELDAEAIKAWGLGQYDNNDILTGIYPHYVFKNIGTEKDPIWVSDGGITFGYGHYVDGGEYKTITSEQALVDTYAKGASILPPTTPSNGVPYKVPNSLAVPIKEAWEILEKDLGVAEDAVNNFLITQDISLNEHQFDILVSFTHNYGDGWWTKTPEKVLPKFIREGKGNYNPEDVIRIFEMHNNETRRRKEAQVFNNGYN